MHLAQNAFREKPLYIVIGLNRDLQFVFSTRACLVVETKSDRCLDVAEFATSRGGLYDLFNAELSPVLRRLGRGTDRFAMSHAHAAFGTSYDVLCNNVSQLPV